jgi:predicted transposase YbfD/YdcC
MVFQYEKISLEGVISKYILTRKMLIKRKRTDTKFRDTYTLSLKMTQGAIRCWRITFQQSFAYQESLHTIHDLIYEGTIRG